MLKEYKKKFILSNLLLVGTVLLIMNTIIFVYSYHSNIDELRIMMSQKLEPYDAIRDMLKNNPPANESGNEENTAPPSPIGGKEGAVPPNEAPEDKEALKQPPPNSKDIKYDKNPKKDFEKYNKSIYVFFYNPSEEKVSVISDSQPEYNLSEIAKTIYSSKDYFGKVKGSGLYYFKQETKNDVKIAIAPKSFIGYKMAELSAVLIFVFMCTMMLFYFVSRHIASIAIKPLEESIMREKQFITDVSHDLKTPVTAILANSDILSKNKDLYVHEVYKWIEGTKQAALNMKTLTEEMLVLFKTENEKDICFTKINFSDIAEKNALFMESLAYEKNISYEVDIEKNIFVNANEEYINRIVSSLTENALKYEKPNGSITVSLVRSGKKAVFCITNKNTVIEKDDLEHIFERFYRSDKSRRSGEGHGLGLAIVKNLVEKINGKISAQSSPAEGTCFTVSLPALSSRINA